jgi:hypothetical protein
MDEYRARAREILATCLTGPDELDAIGQQLAQISPAATQVKWVVQHVRRRTEERHAPLIADELDQLCLKFEDALISFIAASEVKAARERLEQPRTEAASQVLRQLASRERELIEAGQKLNSRIHHENAELHALMLRRLESLDHPYTPLSVRQPAGPWREIEAEQIAVHEAEQTLAAVSGL